MGRCTAAHSVRQHTASLGSRIRLFVSIERTQAMGKSNSQSRQQPGYAYFSITFTMKNAPVGAFFLTLTPLWCATGGLETELLAFLGAWIAFEEALEFQVFAECRIRFEKRAGDAVTHGFRLRLETAAFYDCCHRIGAAGRLEGRIDRLVHDREREVIVSGAIVDGDGRILRTRDADACRCRLTATHCFEVFLVCHMLVVDSQDVSL